MAPNIIPESSPSNTVIHAFHAVSNSLLTTVANIDGIRLDVNFVIFHMRVSDPGDWMCCIKYARPRHVTKDQRGEAKGDQQINSGQNPSSRLASFP